MGRVGGVLSLLAVAAVSGAVSPPCGDVVVNPEAPIKLGLLVSAHESSGASPQKTCDHPSRDGLHLYEAVRFALRRINQNRGQVDGRIVDDSFIPGIKLGVHVVDTCGRTPDPVGRLVRCSRPGSRTFGIIDATMSRSRARAAVPLLRLMGHRRLPPDQTARALTKFVVELGWKEVTVAVGFSNDSSLTTSLMETQLNTYGICVRNVARVVDLPSARLARHLVVIGSKLDIDGALHGVRRRAEELSGVLMSSTPSREHRSSLAPPLGVAVFYLAAQPALIRHLEKEWREMQSVTIPRLSPNAWFIHYAMHRRKCRLYDMGDAPRPGDWPTQTVSPDLSWPICRELALEEDDLDRLLRTQRALPAIHAVFTYANALFSAWQAECGNRPGVCPRLRQLSSAAFQRLYLNPLVFAHAAPGTRSPPELDGSGRGDGHLYGLTVPLVTLHPGVNDTLHLSQVSEFAGLLPPIDGNSSRPVCPRRSPPPPVLDSTAAGAAPQPVTAHPRSRLQRPRRPRPERRRQLITRRVQGGSRNQPPRDRIRTDEIVAPLLTFSPESATVPPQQATSPLDQSSSSTASTTPSVDSSAALTPVSGGAPPGEDTAPPTSEPPSSSTTSLATDATAKSISGLVRNRLRTSVLRPRRPAVRKGMSPLQRWRMRGQLKRPSTAADGSAGAVLNRGRPKGRPLRPAVVDIEEEARRVVDSILATTEDAGSVSDIGDLATVGSAKDTLTQPVRLAAAPRNPNREQNPNLLVSDTGVSTSRPSGAGEVSRSTDWDQSTQLQGLLHSRRPEPFKPSVPTNGHRRPHITRSDGQPVHTARPLPVDPTTISGPVTPVISLLPPNSGSLPTQFQATTSELAPPRGTPPSGPVTTRASSLPPNDGTLPPRVITPAFPLLTPGKRVSPPGLVTPAVKTVPGGRAPPPRLHRPVIRPHRPSSAVVSLPLPTEGSDRPGVVRPEGPSQTTAVNLPDERDSSTLQSPSSSGATEANRREPAKGVNGDSSTTQRGDPDPLTNGPPRRGFTSGREKPGQKPNVRTVASGPRLDTQLRRPGMIDRGDATTEASAGGRSPEPTTDRDTKPGVTLREPERTTEQLSTAGATSGTVASAEEEAGSDSTIAPAPSTTAAAAAGTVLDGTTQTIPTTDTATASERTTDQTTWLGTVSTTVPGTTHTAQRGSTPVGTTVTGVLSDTRTTRPTRKQTLPSVDTSSPTSTTTELNKEHKIAAEYIKKLLIDPTKQTETAGTSRGKGQNDTIGKIEDGIPPVQTQREKTTTDVMNGKEFEPTTSGVVSSTSSSSSVTAQTTQTSPETSSNSPYISNNNPQTTQDPKSTEKFLSHPRTSLPVTKTPTLTLNPHSHVPQAAISTSQTSHATITSQTPTPQASTPGEQESKSGTTSPPVLDKSAGNTTMPTRAPRPVSETVGVTTKSEVSLRLQPKTERPPVTKQGEKPTVSPAVILTDTVSDRPPASSTRQPSQTKTTQAPRATGDLPPSQVNITRPRAVFDGSLKTVALKELEKKTSSRRPTNGPETAQTTQSHESSGQGTPVTDTRKATGSGTIVRPSVTSSTSGRPSTTTVADDDRTSSASSTTDPPTEARVLVLLGIHRRALGGSGCSDEYSEAGVQRWAAVRWSAARLGRRLGLAVRLQPADHCGRPERAARLLSAGSPPLAVLHDLSGGAAAALGAALSLRNVTAVSLVEDGGGERPAPLEFRVQPHPIAEAALLAQMVRSLAARRLRVLYSDTVRSRALAVALTERLREAVPCLEMVAFSRHSAGLAGLNASSAGDGAAAVVSVLSPTDLNRLFEHLMSQPGSGTRILFIGDSTWGANIRLLRRHSLAIVSAILLRPHQPDLTDFGKQFWRSRHQATPRAGAPDGPAAWVRHYWSQCGTKCTLREAAAGDALLATNTLLLALGKLRERDCHVGKCQRNYTPVRAGHRLGEQLRRGISGSAADVAVLGFNGDGFAKRRDDLLNLRNMRRIPTVREMHYVKVGEVDETGVHLSSTVVANHPDGGEVPADSWLMGCPSSTTTAAATATTTSPEGLVTSEGASSTPPSTSPAESAATSTSSATEEIIRHTHPTTEQSPAVDETKKAVLTSGPNRSRPAVVTSNASGARRNRNRTSTYRWPSTSQTTNRQHSTTELQSTRHPKTTTVIAEVTSPHTPSISTSPASSKSDSTTDTTVTTDTSIATILTTEATTTTERPFPGLILTSDSGVYLVISLDVHSPGAAPLSCGRPLASALAALDWAAAVLQRTRRQRPLTAPGLLVLDGCGWPLRRQHQTAALLLAAADLPDTLLAGLVELSGSQAVTQAFQQQEVLTVSRQGAADLGLSLSLSPATAAAGVRRLLARLQWRLCAAVHAPHSPWYSQVLRQLTAAPGPARMATSLTLSADPGAEELERAVAALRTARQSGAQVLVVLLPAPLLDSLLQHMRRQQFSMFIVAVQLNRDGNINYAGMRGVIRLVPPRTPHPAGALPRTQLTRDLWPRAVRDDLGSSWSDTVTAVNALNYNLQLMAEAVCADDCDVSSLAALEPDDLTRHMTSVTFPAASGHLTSFGPDHYMLSAYLQVENLWREGGASRWRLAGNCSRAGGLRLDVGALVALGEGGETVPASSLLSQCTSCNTDDDQPLIMEVSLNRSSYQLAILAAVHEPGEDIFSCGALADTTTFLSVAAAARAVSASSLPVGARVLDSCGRPERARDQLFGLLSSAAADPRRLVGVISLSEATCEAVAGMLEHAAVPHVCVPAGGHGAIYDELTQPYRTVPPVEREVHALVSLARRLGWGYVSVLHSMDAYGVHALQQLRQTAPPHDICVGSVIGIDAGFDAAAAEGAWAELRRQHAAPTILLLVSRPEKTRLFLETASRLGVDEDVLFVGGRYWSRHWATEEIAPALNQAVFVTLPQSEDDSESGSSESPRSDDEDASVLQWLGAMTTEQHEPFPDTWFSEYDHRRQRCQPQSPPRRACTEQELLTNTSSPLWPYVQHAELAVTSLLDSLGGYLHHHCVPTEPCARLVGAELMQLMDARFGNGSSRRVLERDGLQVWTLQEGVGFSPLGGYRRGLLRLLPVPTVARLQLRHSSCETGPCLQTCASQSDQLASLTDGLPSEQGGVSGIFGVVCIVLSALGVLLALACLVYFNISAGRICRSPVDCQVLLGLVLVCSDNAAFLLPPAATVCGTRRFLTGLAYATVYSALLVKVIHLWRVHGGRCEELSQRGALLLVSLCLLAIQALLGAAWLVLSPPSVRLLDGVLLCSPPGTFEQDLAVSLSYVLVLKLTLVCFCLATWRNPESHQEPRWLLATVAATSATWAVWLGVVLDGRVTRKDGATVVCNLVCVSVFFICLYLRKVLLFNYLWRNPDDPDLNSPMTVSTIHNSFLMQMPAKLKNFSQVRTPQLSERIQENARTWNPAVEENSASLTFGDDESCDLDRSLSVHEFPPQRPSAIDCLHVEAVNSSSESEDMDHYANPKALNELVRRLGDRTVLVLPNDRGSEDEDSKI